MEVVVHLVDGEDGDRGCQHCIQRPLHPCGVEFVRGERDHLCGCVDPLVGPSGNVRVDGTCVPEEGSFEVTLDGADLGLSCVAVESGPVVGEREAVRRHLEDADADQDGLQDRVGDPPPDRRHERPVA